MKNESDTRHLLLDSSEVLVKLGFDIINKFQDFGNHSFLVLFHSFVHLVNFQFGVRFNFSRYIISGSHKLGFILSENLLPFLSVLFDIILSFFLGLLQSSCFSFLGFGHFLSGPLFSCQQLLDSMGLTCHCRAFELPTEQIIFI
uniref:Uncharacterized protein n=1 Tax=Cacopsylla melanoneura TaxID=428564 RepID=A0A8D8W9D1_9HEMI